MPRHARQPHAPARSRSVIGLALLAVAVLVAWWALRPADGDDDASRALDATSLQASAGIRANDVPVAGGAMPGARPHPPGAARPANAPAEAIPASAIPPAFPLEAVRRGESGRVLLRVPVGEDGVPGRLSLVQSSGSEVLDRAALDAVSHWRFRPARRNGDDVASSLEIPIDFRPPE